MVKAFEAASDRKVDHALILICSEFMSYLLVICCDCLFLMFGDVLCYCQTDAVAVWID